jgi:hypothetical protein
VVLPKPYRQEFYLSMLTFLFHLDVKQINYSEACLFTNYAKGPKGVFPMEKQTFLHNSQQADINPVTG